MEWNGYSVRIFVFDIIEYFICYSNHFKGQDTLYVNVYDEDTLQNDEIGSFTIDLKDLYEKGISH